STRDRSPSSMRVCGGTADATTADDAQRRRQTERDQAPVLPDDAANRSGRFDESAGAPQIDGERRGAGARRRLHGWSGADAVGLGSGAQTEGRPQTKTVSVARTAAARTDAGLIVACGSRDALARRVAQRARNVPI